MARWEKWATLDYRLALAHGGPANRAGQSHEYEYLCTGNRQAVIPAQAHKR
jgi:hypothetical protein